MDHSEDHLPAGFRYSGVTCGIKASGKSDLALIVADHPVTAAGVYTLNQVVAAPVVLSRSRTPSSTLRAVVTNSGNANACTGDAGMDDAKSMCQMVADQIGCSQEDVLVMSTGVIGRPLPMDKITAGIGQAAKELSAESPAFVRAAEAIRTTDAERKTVTRTIQIGDREIRFAAMAKGAGMIAPNMATMLAVMLTDAPLSADSIKQVLAEAADRSFNRVSVDGHTSTNDTFLLLASGQGEPLAGDDLAQFQIQINEVAIALAKQLVEDGEGAAHTMAIRVTGAGNTHDAEVIAKTVAASPLVKTAITGGDPNWGRIVSAAGYAEAKINPAKTSLTICGQEIYRDGTPVPFDAKSLSEKMRAQKEVPLELTVGDGPGTADYWSSDLTCEYVRFNSEYTT
ncbi:Arginine biosynthesis bifunctional protein ArgJ [Rubripirellula lacrimiformis]|uniref:Arginine biosynthesis bifunctional protein ArgJ n=1 Tax=Rubripirellula lacrimiformis TaxID=1930273 RepID=A0A517NGE2_9BACT|nr:bifunctional glutamate N-acetyltransferase/amino-acid acetyltransferase ArgJ [Rubripirellula lacrimiformis]QDT06206.1 Arginine biosynthesis bifunctional protein ArgJ [Rubripirellula lacrimiformis]